VPVRAFDPGIFYQSETGLGAILVAGTGKTTNERAVNAGEIVEIYCTGLGALRSSLSALPETVARPQVLIGGREAEVLFSGGWGGIPGAYQVNARVPAGTGSGTQPVVIRVEGAASNTVQMVVGGS
jgi:uncharacterized protein (TIGR03437 family)